MSLRVTTGFVEYGKFSLGDNARFATTLFSQLQGDPDVSDTDMLQMELRELRNDLLVNLQLRNCSLDELMENCKLITREIFKAWNIDRTTGIA